MHTQALARTLDPERGTLCPASSRLALGACLLALAGAWLAVPARSAACAVPAPDTHPSAPPFSTVATFSIVGFDAATGDLGVAVQSKFFAVGAVVPYAKTGVGAIATQAFANTTFGPRGLELLAKGLHARAVLDSLLAGDPQREQRQVGVVDARGNSSVHTGKECLVWAGHLSGENFTAQGNILVGKETVEAMASAFRSTEGILGEKLLRALEEGQKAGGDSRGQQSAALLVVRAGGGYGGYDDRYCDLRVDDHPEPIRELRRLFDLWKGWALVLEGYKLCDAEHWEAAFAAGREAIALDPEKGEPYYHLACYYSKAGEADLALDTLAEAVRRDETLGARAKTDTDFEPLWKQARFLAIVGR
jgi:uncharacterized Ntn-hydrolase superfamily protein